MVQGYVLAEHPYFQEITRFLHYVRDPDLCSQVTITEFKRVLGYMRQIVYPQGSEQELFDAIDSVVEDSGCENAHDLLQILFVVLNVEEVDLVSISLFFSTTASKMVH